MNNRKMKIACVGLLTAALGIVLPAPAALASPWSRTEAGWTYLTESGEKATGWVSDEGKWYFLDENGLMKTGWISDQGKWYLLSADGSMVTGRLEDEETEYLFASTGEFLTALHIQNDGGGSFPIGFYTETQQEMADDLNDWKREFQEEDDDSSESEDSAPRDYDRYKAFQIDAELQRAAEHRLEAALSSGYDNHKIPGEGSIDDYYAAFAPRYRNRRHLEIYIAKSADESTALDRIMSRYRETKKKRTDRAVYYTRAGIAAQEKNGRLYYMIELAR